MSTIVKAGLLLGGGSVIAAGSYLAISGLGYSPVTLNEESNTDTDYNNKIGNDFKYFLVSPFNKKNERFWNERFQALKASTDLSTEFTKDSKVAKAFAENKTGGTNDDKALNRVCYDLYKGKAKSDLDLTDNTKKKLTTDLFTYCSVLGGLPTTVKDDQSQNRKTYDSGKLGKDKEDKLVALNGNDTWWNLKTKEFFGSNEPTDDKFFIPFHQGKKGSLRTKCEEAYGKESNTSSSAPDKPKADEVLKYCSLLGS